MSGQITLAGWIFLIGAWSAILLLNIICFGRIFRERKNKIAEPNQIEY